MIRKTLYRNFILFIFIILTLPLAGMGQDTDPLAGKQRNQVQFYVDHAQFRASGDSVLLEVYLMIPRQQFSYVKPDTLDQFIARGFIQAGLAQSDSMRLLDRWPVNDAVKDTSLVKNTQNIPDIAVFKADPGEYELIVQVIDLNSKTRGLYRERVTLHPFTQKKLTISDIEFASLVQPADGKTVFTKYNRDVVPNASLTFSVANPILYSYAEIYNMEYPSDNDSFAVQYKILDLNNSEVKAPQKVVREKVGSSSVDIGGLNVVGLSSGVYLYRIRAEDLGTGEVATRSKKFYVYKPGERIAKPGSKAQLAQDYASKSEAELDTIFNALEPILQGKEKRAYRNANVEGKRSLLTEFWDRRDPDPTTEVNEMQVSYSRRMQHVKEQYGSLQTAGYDTDRGRIYLEYGKPDEVERNPVSIDVKPHEIWHYHSIQGGVRFVFVDKTGFGSYELVHSTARNEIHDPNWRRFIRTAPSGSGFRQEQNF